MKYISRQDIYIYCTITLYLYYRDSISLIQVSGDISAGKTFSSYKGIDFIT